MTPGEGDQGAAGGAGTASGAGAGAAGDGQGAAGTGAAAGAAQGSAGAVGGAAGSGSAGPAAAGDGGQLDAAASTRELEAARKEAAKYRTELQKLKDEQKAAADAKLTDDEKRAKDLADKEAELTAREQRSRQAAAAGSIAVTAASQGVPAGKVDLVRKLLLGDVEYDDAGEPKNISQLVAALLKDHPEFKAGPGSSSGSADGGARGKSTLTVEEVRKMKPEEINARWPEVQEVLARR